MERSPVSTPTILIVDDEPVNISILVELLKSDYHVKGANSGEAALRVAALEPHPDLILLDVMMPRMDGYMVFRKLREQPETRDIPVIFITALSDETDEEYGLQLGATDYITKPVKPRIVMARVQTQLELKRARDRMKDENLWLENEVRRRMHENLLIQDVTLEVMSELAETRDTETGNHIIRTRLYVEVLARDLQINSSYAEELTEAHLKRIVKAAPLHDIGKIGIPDHILLKPGRLTPEEFEIMKSHARLGGEAIGHAIAKTLAKHPDHQSAQKPESLSFLEVAQTIAHRHHEKWDGSGYPDNLSGRDIPLAARLMAVADVFDALTMRRVYKKPWSHEDAIAYILAQEGKHFDPEVIAAFRRVQKQVIDISEDLADKESAVG
jgi:putative two-component system response regulator